MENMENFEHRSAMAIYFAEVKKMNNNTKEENQFYIEMLKTENRDYAIQKLIEGNLKFAIKMALNFRGRGLNFDDLIAEANYGLCRAVEKFDIQYGKSFLTYAQWWIRSAISRAICDSYIVRVSNQMELRKRQVNNFINEFKQEFDKDPTIQDIADGMKLSLVEVRHVLRAENNTISMNQKFDDGDSDSDEMGDVLANQLDSSSTVETFIENDFHAALRKYVNELPTPYNTIIKMRYGIGCDKAYTLDEVASVIGKTSERVRQIQAEALRKLKPMI